jgi:hypothetical protein
MKMIYQFECEKRHVTEIEKSMDESIPGTIECSECKRLASRKWSASVHVPEHFRATSDLYNRKDGADFSYVKGRMQHGKRPSGKDKTVF